MEDGKEEPRTLSHIDTVDAIAEDVAGKLVAKDRETLRDGTLEQARAMHHGLGTWIRNTYGLWSDNALTVAWRTDSRNHRVVDGVDYSEDHPDAVSDLVIQAVWRRLQ